LNFFEDNGLENTIFIYLFGLGALYGSDQQYSKHKNSLHTIFLDCNDIVKRLIFNIFSTTVTKNDITKVVNDESEVTKLPCRRIPRLKKAINESLTWWREVQRLLTPEKAEFVVEKVLKKRRRNVSNKH
jgi:hypothetical protein